MFEGARPARIDSSSASLSKPTAWQCKARVEDEEDKPGSSKAAHCQSRSYAFASSGSSNNSSSSSISSSFSTGASSETNCKAPPISKRASLFVDDDGQEVLAVILEKNGARKTRLVQLADGTGYFLGNGKLSERFLRRRDRAKSLPNTAQSAKAPKRTSLDSGKARKSGSISVADGRVCEVNSEPKVETHNSRAARVTTFKLEPTYIPPSEADARNGDTDDAHLVGDYVITAEQLKLAREKSREKIRRIVAIVGVTLTLLAIVLVAAFLALGSKLEKQVERNANNQMYKSNSPFAEDAKNVPPQTASLPSGASVNASRSSANNLIEPEVHRREASDTSSKKAPVAVAERFL